MADSAYPHVITVSPSLETSHTRLNGISVMLLSLLNSLLAIRSISLQEDM